MKFKNAVQFCEDGYFHIFNRTVNNEPVFESKEVRIRFKKIVRKRMGKFIDIRNYVLIPNHYHLILKQKVITKTYLNDVAKINSNAARKFLEDPENQDLYSLFISSLHQSAWHEFTVFYNRLMDRKGPLMCGRFKRKQIDPKHVPYVIAYLHNNPRHHGFVEDLDKWEDSSHNDPEFQDWIKEFGKETFDELAEGPGEGYKGNAGLYYRLLEVVNKIKMKQIAGVPKEIWAELQKLLEAKEEEEFKQLRKQTSYLINFQRTVL